MLEKPKRDNTIKMNVDKTDCDDEKYSVRFQPGIPKSRI
jgi:hypothetical protein